MVDALRVRRTVALLVCFCLLHPVLSSDPAEAARFLGCRQPSSTVLIANNAPAPYNTLAANAAASWRFPGSRVNVQMVPPGTWTINSFGAFAWGNTGWTGIFTSACSGGVWTNPANAWVNRTFTDSYPNPGRQSVIAHEFGHMLGLDHNPAGTIPGLPGNCPWVVLMYSNDDRWFQCFVNQPMTDDRLGVNSLY